MAQALISSKNQIVIPKEAREALGVRAGDRVSIVVRGSRVIVMAKAEKPHAALRGLAKKPYPEGYLQKERGTWR